LEYRFPKIIFHHEQAVLMSDRANEIGSQKDGGDKSKKLIVLCFHLSIAVIK